MRIHALTKNQYQRPTQAITGYFMKTRIWYKEADVAI